MQVEGTATVNICANNLMCSVDAVISSDLRDDLLTGCEDLRCLKIIPANFPHQTVRAVSSLESMKQKLLEKFPDTLSDSLSPIPMCTPDGHMHINMYQHATPHQEVVARRIPLWYKPQTDSVVQDLISKNVITKVDIPTRWVSPAFFVPKPDGIRMRLVTDYTKGHHSVNPTRTEAVREARRRARVFSAGPRRGVVISDNIPFTPGSLQISTCPHGSKRIIRRMVPTFRRRRQGPGLVHEDRGRLHHHLGDKHRRDVVDNKHRA